MSSKVAYTKEPLLPSAALEVAPPKRGCSAGLRVVKALLLGMTALACANALGFAPLPEFVSDALLPELYNAKPQCPQVSAIVPEKNAGLWDSVGSTIGSDAFKARAVEWLGGAVRVP